MLGFTALTGVEVGFRRGDGGATGRVVIPIVLKERHPGFRRPDGSSEV